MRKRGNLFVWGIWVALLLATAISNRAAANDKTEVVYLSGRGKDDPVQWEFYCTKGRRSGQWATIGVPSNWELQGFGNYNYGHDRPKADEQGKYRRTFDVPRRWRDKRVFIIFEGVMTDTEVRINGTSAGPKHQGGFYRFKYEITDLVRTGENRLEVTVSKVSSDPSVEAAERQADYWVFGGIYRPVYLEVVPHEFIEWVAIDAQADGRFRVDVHSRKDRSLGPLHLHVKITGPGRERPWVVAASIDAAEERATLKTVVPAIKPWTAETPNLYEAEVTLGRAGRPIHRVTKRFGFRTFEVRPGDGLYLNGQKICLKGVNRHSFWPDSGRCLSEEISYADARLIKEMNMNAVRMSHYPPDQHFLDACDELGLYVLDELAGWQKPPYDTDIGKKLIKEMVPRDVCHPCILFWDNGNEGGWNRDLDDQFALYDPQNRTVLHPWESFNAIDTDHYESYASVQKKLSGSTLFMPTEFLHGLYDGGHGAGLYDHWHLMRSSPLTAGGFLWVLCDEGVVRTDQGGRIDTDGSHAPDGIVGPYREREASFHTIKEIWSPVHIGLTRLPTGLDRSVPVENRYDFTNLRDCSFEVKLADFPRPGDDATGHTVSFERSFPGPDVEPHASGVIELGLLANWHDADALYLTAYGPARQKIWTWSWDLRPAHYYQKQCAAMDVTGAEPARAIVQDDDVQVKAGRQTLRFSRETGELVEVVAGERRFAFRGPAPVHGTSKIARLTCSQRQGAVLVDVAYEGTMNHARWQITPSGWVCLEYAYDREGPFDLLGVSFDYPEHRMRAMRWLGRGPYRVWKNRLKGGTFDVWSNTYKDHTPGVTWDFPEFRGYYHHWRWVVFSTDDGEITVVNGTSNLFLGVYRPSDGPDPRKTKLDVPDTGIAFLHGIPAIGTKFQRPEALGPQGRKNQASGTYRGTVWFHFGR